MRDRAQRTIAALLAGGIALQLAGCSVRVQRQPDWGGSSAQPSAGSLRGFIRLTNKWLAPEMVDRIALALVRECEANRLDVRVVAALIAKESSFNPKAINPAGGARGLGQLMPDTARWLGVQDPYDPEQNIAGICKYLAHLRDRWSGSSEWVRILASYRLGQGTIQRSLQTNGTIPAVGLEYAQDVLGRASRITSIG
jgi:hypothetical protein